MAIRAMIGKVDRRGNGQAIYLGHDGCPDQAGDALLQHYSEEERIDRLISRGYVTWLKPTPEASVTYHSDYGYSWEICQPDTFSGGTEAFFARYWGVGAEWLYAWAARRLVELRSHAGGTARKLSRRFGGPAGRRSPMARVAAPDAGVPAAAVAPYPD